jgi:hypothetical protein
MDQPSTSRALPVVIPPRPLRLVGLLISLGAALVLLATRSESGGFPRKDLLYALLAYLFGPGGLSLAAITFLPPRSKWLFPAVVASYLLGLGIFLVLAVNLGAISP